MTSFVLSYGEERIPYQVAYDDHRSSRVAIHVNPDGSVAVEAPTGYSEGSIKQAVQKRARWVCQRQSKIGPKGSAKCCHIEGGVMRVQP